MPLKVSDGIAAWIKDFKKSDAPQFKGKDEKERRDQAIAAYLSAKRGDQNENVKSADKKPEVYTKPDGKRAIRMVATDRDVIKTEAKRVVHSDRPDSLKSLRVMHPKPASDKIPFDGPYRKAGEVKKVKEKTVGFKTDPKLPNLKMPVNRKQGKIFNPKTRKFEAVDEAAPKPLNRSDHTHTVHIDGEGKYRVKAKSMDHAKKLAFKQAGISKLHGHPTMEPKTRIMGESVNEEATFKVNIEGLPMMFISGMGSGDVKAKLRAIVKQPSMIQSVKRVTDVEVKKNFRLKAQGRDEEEQMDEAKDPGEYDQEGSMAKTQLRGIMRDVSNMMKMFKDDDNLPEWVQNKITKAADYLNSSNRYMTDNEND